MRPRCTFRGLNVIDDCLRECLCSEVATGLVGYFVTASENGCARNVAIPRRFAATMTASLSAIGAELRDAPRHPLPIQRSQKAAAELAFRLSCGSGCGDGSILGFAVGRSANSRYSTPVAAEADGEPIRLTASRSAAYHHHDIDIVEFLDVALFAHRVHLSTYHYARRGSHMPPNYRR